MKVLITRPRAQADALAERVRASGHEPLIYPALAIAPVADAAPLDAALARLASYQLVIFVSPNAIEHALARLRAPWPAAVAIGVMGPGSIAALGAHGIVAPQYTIHAPGIGADGAARFDSEALFERLAPAGLRGARVLIIKGNGGRPWLATHLAAAGAIVDLVESYRRDKPRGDAAVEAQLRLLIASGAPAAVVVTSSEGLAHLCTLLDALGGAAAMAWLRACPWLVPHARIAENATAAGMAQVLLTGPGDENISRTLESMGH